MYQYNHRHSEPEQRLHRLMPEDKHPKVSTDGATCRSKTQQYPLRDTPPVVDCFQFIKAVDKKSYDIDGDKKVETHNKLITLLENIFYNTGKPLS